MKPYSLALIAGSALLLAVSSIVMTKSQSTETKSERAEAVAADQPLCTDALVDLQASNTPMPPDEFSWKIFAAISAPVSSAKQQTIVLPDDSTVTTNDVVWEQWADNNLTFQTSGPDGQLNSHNRPVSPAGECPNDDQLAPGKSPTKHLQLDPVAVLLQAESVNSAPRVKVQPQRAGEKPGFESPTIASGGDITTNAAGRIPPGRHDVGGADVTTNVAGPAPSGLHEEVRRNKTSFDFLVNNNYWNEEGLRDAVAARKAKGIVDSIFLMPAHSMEVKANWHLCGVSDPVCGTTHLNYGSDGKRYGLIALHVMTKDLHKWTWSTWEWAGDGNTKDGLDGNEGRCDYIGCVDRFGSAVGTGMNKGVTPTRGSDQLGRKYAPGPLTPQLEAVFRAYKLAPEWRNYRLKATQVDYDQPIVAGNSVIEAHYVQSSSCITCHSRASVNATGSTEGPLGSLFVDQQGPIGPLKENWFTGQVAPLPAPQSQVYYRVDFVWSLLHARNAK